MKQYLVAGHIVFHTPSQFLPIKGVAALEDHEVMDLPTLAKVEAILLHEHNTLGKMAVAKAIVLHSFQPFETPAVAQPAAEPHLNPEEQSLHHRWVEEIRDLRHTLDDLGVPVRAEGVVPTVARLLRNQAALNSAVHLNECSVVLPPVDSPLLIEIAPGVLLRATRPAHAESKLSQLAFDLENGRYYGRPRWTHA